MGKKFSQTFKGLAFVQAQPHGLTKEQIAENRKASKKLRDANARVEKIKAAKEKKHA